MINDHLGDGNIVKIKPARVSYVTGYFKTTSEMVFRVWDMNEVLEAEARPEISVYLVYKKISKIINKV